MKKIVIGIIVVIVLMSTLLIGCGESEMTYEEMIRKEEEFRRELPERIILNDDSDLEVVARQMYISWDEQEEMTAVYMVMEDGYMIGELTISESGNWDFDI